MGGRSGLQNPNRGRGEGWWGRDRNTRRADTIENETESRETVAAASRREEGPASSRRRRRRRRQTEREATLRGRTHDKRCRWGSNLMTSPGALPQNLKRRGGRGVGCEVMTHGSIMGRNGEGHGGQCHERYATQVHQRRWVSAPRTGDKSGCAYNKVPTKGEEAMRGPGQEGLLGTAPPRTRDLTPPLEPLAGPSAGATEHKRTPKVHWLVGCCALREVRRSQTEGEGEVGVGRPRRGPWGRHDTQTRRRPVPCLAAE